MTESPSLLNAALLGLSALVCAAAGAAVVAVGPAGAVAIALLVGAVLLVRHPGVALGVFLGSVILVEGDPQGFFAAQGRFYEPVAGPLTGPDLLLGIAVLAAALDLGRRGARPRMAGSLTLALLLLAAAVCIGAATGYLDGGGRNDIIDSVHILAYLLVVPFLVTNVVRTRADVLLLVVLAGVAAVVKGVEGTVAWLLGEGRPFEGTTLTYYQPPANWLLLVFVLTVVAAGLSHRALPLWARLGSLPAAAALLLSFRRSFWIAAVLGIVLVVLLSRGGPGRRVLLLSALLVAVAGSVAVARGGGTEGQGRVVERAASLRPTRIEASREDRYRLVEQRNVLAEIAEHPLTGIGLGVPWQIRHPLPEHHPAGTLYTHVVGLWYWLKLGLAGLIAYAVLMGAALRSAFRLSKAHPDGLVRVCATAVAAGLVGLLVAETTGSFTGVSLRFSILIGAVLGALASAERAVQRTAST